MSAPGIAPIIQQAGATLGRRCPNIGSHVAVVPNALLRRLAASPFVDYLSLDRDVVGTDGRTSATIGATAVRQEFGYDGSGVGVAIIDSGVAPGMTILRTMPARCASIGSSISSAAHATAYDDYGHGTHVAGIIAGNGFDSGGARAGIAPGAHLIVLKALDADGQGTHQRRDRGARLCGGAARRPEHPRDQSVGRGWRVRVVQRRSADACRAARRAGRASSWSPPPGTSAGALDGHTQYGGITAPGERAVGVDGRRIEPYGNRGPFRRYDRDVHVSRTDGRGCSRQAGHRRAGRRHRIARGSRQRAVHCPPPRTC